MDVLAKMHRIELSVVNCQVLQRYAENQEIMKYSLAENLRQYGSAKALNFTDACMTFGEGVGWLPREKIINR